MTVNSPPAPNTVSSPSTVWAEESTRPCGLANDAKPQAAEQAVTETIAPRPSTYRKGVLTMLARHNLATAALVLLTATVIGVGTGVTSGPKAASTSGDGVDLDKIRPGMSREELDRARQEILRVASQNMK